jgi:RHS repeat-associated protein
MERDEETGLNYHTARYYAAWFGKWTSTDPSWVRDGFNLYSYSRGNPLRHTDKSGTQSTSSQEYRLSYPSLDSRYLLLDEDERLHISDEYRTTSGLIGNKDERSYSLDCEELNLQLSIEDLRLSSLDLYVNAALLLESAGIRMTPQVNQQLAAFRDTAGFGPRGIYPKQKLFCQ